MLFYTIIASMEEAEEPVQSREAPEDKELAGKLLACSEANYQQNGQNYYFFAKGIKKTRIQFGAVFKSATDVLPAFSDYLQEAGMAADDISMENNRDNMVVIFAGYPDPMEQFLSRNPGLRSRIAFHVPFPDYNTEELVSIAELLAGKKGLHFTQQACDKLRNVLSTARTSADFGNGRYVRSLLEQARMEQASRIVKMNGETLTEETLRTLTAEDIPDCNISGLTEKRRIGFDTIHY